MRKILAIILVALMALSFVPFRNVKQVEAASNTKATMVLNTLHEIVPLIRDPLNADPTKQDIDRTDYTLNFEPIYWDFSEPHALPNGLVDSSDTLIAGNRVPVQASPNAITLTEFSTTNYMKWIDANGNILWEPSLDSLYYDVGDKVGQIDDGDVLIAGVAKPNGTALATLAANFKFVDIDLNGFWGPVPTRKFDLYLGTTSYPWLPQLKDLQQNPLPDLLYPTETITSNVYGNDFAKIFATDMYLTAESEGSLSRLTDRYYVIAEEGKELWFDVDDDGVFDPDDMIVLDVFSTGVNPTIDVGDIILYSLQLKTPFIVQPDSKYQQLPIVPPITCPSPVPLVGNTLTLIPEDIYHTDNIVENGQYDPGEWIYINNDDSGAFVSVVDSSDNRLTPVTIDGHFYPVNSTVYELATGNLGYLDPLDDLDVEMPLVSFRDTEDNPRHARWFFIDPDTRFNVTNPKDPDPLNNTMGPFSLGSTIKITQGSASGRVFQIGWIDWVQEEQQTPPPGLNYIPMSIGNRYKPMVNGDVVKGKNIAPPQNLDSGDIFCFFEVLTASCCGNKVIYDISIESDVEPVLWPNPLTNNPVATAVLGPGTGNDFPVMTKELARSTAYGVSTTTFFDIELKNREFLDLEIFRDDGINVYSGGSTIRDDQKDNFSFPAGGIAFGEEFLGNHTFPYLNFWTNSLGFGAQVPYDVLDSYNVLYVDYGTSKVRYIDIDDSVDVSAGDIRIDPYLIYPAWSIVGPNDPDTTFGTSAPQIVVPYFYIDYNHDRVYNWWEEVNWDAPPEFQATVDKFPGKELKNIVPNTATTNDDVRSVVRGIDMYHGDWKAMDIMVRPGKFTLDVEIKPDKDSVTSIKVEQTYTVTVSIDPDCLDINDKVYVTLELPGYDTNGIEGYELITSPLVLSKTVTTVKFHNVTAWRGSQLKDLKNFTTPGFRVSGYLVKGNDFVGPFDTTDKDGLKIIISPFTPTVGITRAVIPEAFNVYDCLFQKVYNIEPEGLKVTKSEDCLSYLDQRFPNIYFTIENAKSEDLDNPYGLIREQASEGLFAYILATGGGIKYHAVVVRGTTRYLLQVNSDGTVFRWTWPGDILLSGPPLPLGTTLFDDPLVKFVNNVIDTNTTWDGGEPIYYDVLNNNIVDKDDILLYGPAASLGSCLIDDPKLLVADNPNFVNDTRYGPRNANSWDYGEPVYWSTNNVIDVDNDNVYDKGDTGTNPAITETGGVLTDSNENGIPDPNEKISGVSGTFYVLTYPFPSRIEKDGKIYAMIKPATKECSDINITIFTNYIMYNFLGPRPPTYILEQDRYPLNDSGLPGPQALDHGLVDYKGSPDKPIRTEKIYDLNFAEFEIVDEALEHSIFSNPYPPYGPAGNQDPWVLKNLIMELRCYPGGQTNLPGSGWGYDYRKLPDIGPANAFAVVGLTNGWNARHAQIRDMLWKLGTEYYPLTDYTIRFIAKLKDGTHVIPDYIEIVGEKASTEGQPVFMVGPYDGPYTYDPTGVENLPKNYKYYNYWLNYPSEVTTIPNYPGMYVKDGYVFEDGWILNDVVEVKGIIPTGPGYIVINIYYGDYVTTYKYCTSCMDTPAKIPVHAIELVPNKSELQVDADNLLEVTAKIYPFDKETSPYGEIASGNQPLASQSLVFVWQDRGVLDPVKPSLGIRHGVGDGWITGQQPKFGGSPIDTLSGTTYNAGPVYNAKDINGDGLITYEDLETEIVGK